MVKSVQASTLERPATHQAKQGHQAQNSEQRGTEGRAEKRTYEHKKKPSSKFVTDRKPKAKKHKTYNKKSGGFKSDGSAPMKRAL